MFGEILDLSSIYIKSRFHSTPFTIYGLCVYVPIGLLLSALRLFIAFHVLLISLLLKRVPHFRRVILRVFYWILGIIVVPETECDAEKCSGIKLIVSNHPTTLDTFVVDSIMPCVWYDNELGRTFWRAFANLTNFGLSSYHLSNMNEEMLSEKGRSFVKNAHLPLLVFPEQRRTKTSRAILKFDPFAFTLCEEATVLSISTKRPWIFNSIVTGTLTSSVVADLFWFTFVPFTVFHVKIQKVKRLEDESVQQFCKRVQNVMASNLRVPVFDHTFHDLCRMAQLRQKRLANLATEMQAPVKIIKNILPKLPDDAIREELGSSLDIDRALEHLLTRYDAFCNSVTSEDKKSNVLSTDFRSFKQHFKEQHQEAVIYNLRKYLERHKNT